MKRFRSNPPSDRQLASRWRAHTSVARALLVSHVFVLVACGGASEPIVTGAEPAPGSLDKSFGMDGIVQTRIGTYEADAAAVAVQPDGKIVVVGNLYTTVEDQHSDGSPGHELAGMAVVRYRPDGSLDDSFGDGGIVTSTSENAAARSGRGLALGSNGRIIVLGLTTPERPFRDALVRYDSRGALDTSFGTAGFAALVGPQAVGLAVTVQGNGKALVAGIDDAFAKSFMVVRYLADGTPDRDFGDRGVTTTDIRSSARARAIALQADGKIVLAGDAGVDSVTALARYNTTGILDDSFGDHGIVTQAVGRYHSAANAVAVQDDGRIVVAVSSFDGEALLRYTTEGHLDASFGSDGTVALHGPSTETLGIQGDGKIVLATPYREAGPCQLVRYERGGTLDASFGAGGKASAAPRIGGCGVSAIAIQADGKLIAAGRVVDGDRWVSTVVRFWP